MGATSYFLIGRDREYCRVYYRRGVTLGIYCLQYDGRAEGVHWYACTKDGEPSHRVQRPDASEFDILEEPETR